MGSESEKQSETELLVRMPQSMRDELAARAAADQDEGSSMSKIVRRALREFFRRHPRSTS